MADEVIEGFRRLRLLDRLEELRHAEGGQHADDDDHDREFDEGEPFTGPHSVRQVSAWSVALSRYLIRIQVINRQKLVLQVLRPRPSWLQPARRTRRMGGAIRQGQAWQPSLPSIVPGNDSVDLRALPMWMRRRRPAVDIPPVTLNARSYPAFVKSVRDRW